MIILHIIGMLIVGLIAGAIARVIAPGRHQMGLIMTTLLGIAGSFLGGFIWEVIWHQEGLRYFRSGGLFLSIIGAVLILLISRMFRHQPAGPTHT